MDCSIPESFVSVIFAPGTNAPVGSEIDPNNLPARSACSAALASTRGSCISGKRAGASKRLIAPDTATVRDPDTVARDLAQLAAAGLTGIAVSFVNYLDELPYFCAEVLPRLARAGLRAEPGAI